MSSNTTNFIPFASMNFGTEHNSKCGICSLPEEGYWKNGNLQEDILCLGCSSEWKYNENKNGYEKTKPTTQQLLKEHLTRLRNEYNCLMSQFSSCKNPIEWEELRETIEDNLEQQARIIRIQISHDQ